MKTTLFRCENGLYYVFPENHCVFCEQCNHMLYDYTNGPYMFTCDLEYDSYETCNSFSYDGFSRIIIGEEE